MATSPPPEMITIAKGEVLTYVYGMFGAIGLCVVLIVLIMVFWTWLRPVWPYLKSRNSPDHPLLMLFQKNKRVQWITGNYKAEVYEKDDLENPLAFCKNDQDGYKLGQADTEVFYDGANIATSPELAVCVRELVKMGYKNIDEVVQAVRAGTLKQEDLVIPLVSTFDPAMVVQFCTGKPAIMKAWADTKLNIDRQKRDKPFYENPQVMSLAFIIICGCLGIGIMKSMGVF